MLHLPFPFLYSFPLGLRKQRWRLRFRRGGRGWRRCGIGRAGRLRGLLACFFARRLRRSIDFRLGGGKRGLKSQMRSSEFHQLLRKLPVEFLGGSCERKRRGYGCIFCF